MGNPFQKVRKGEPLAFNATAYNAMIDAAVDNMRSKVSGNGLNMPFIVKVRNETGNDLDFGKAVGIKKHLFEAPPPGTNSRAELRHFKDCNYAAVMPEEDLSLGILLTPLKDGKVGRAQINGVVRAVVDVKSTSDERVTFTASTNDLESSSDGDLSFLIPPDSTGLQWCDLVFGRGGGGGGEAIPCRFGITLVAFNAGTVGNVQIYNNFAMTSSTTVKALVPPNYAQVAIAANTPCIVVPCDYTINNETIKWMIVSILYSSSTPTP